MIKKSKGVSVLPLFWSIAWARNMENKQAYKDHKGPLTGHKDAFCYLMQQNQQPGVQPMVRLQASVWALMGARKVDLKVWMRYTTNDGTEGVRLQDLMIWYARTTIQGKYKWDLMGRSVGLLTQIEVRVTLSRYFPPVIIVITQVLLTQLSCFITIHLIISPRVVLIIVHLITLCLGTGSKKGKMEDGLMKGA